jgi:hypothetical protein
MVEEGSSEQLIFDNCKSIQIDRTATDRLNRVWDVKQIHQGVRFTLREPDDEEEMSLFEEPESIEIEVFPKSTVLYIINKFLKKSNTV